MVVVTEEKKRRTGLVWLAVGTALAVASVGGGTFALWTTTETFAGGTISAGDLDLVQSRDTAFYDVSEKRTDAKDTVPGTDGTQKGHTITADTWKMVPGDKVAAAFAATVTLDGDNLVAELSAQGLNSIGSAKNTHLKWTYEIYADSKPIISESPLPTAAKSTLLYLSATGNGQSAGLDDNTVDTAALPIDSVVATNAVIQLDAITANATTADLTVVIYGTFDYDTPGTEDVVTADTLQKLRLNLDQVRDTGKIFG
jgi:alternate signal-mediated exported protein